MALDLDDIIIAAESHAATTGYFERVNKHEPKNAPGKGLTCALWLRSIDPIKGGGLASVNVKIVLNVRLYSNMLQEPQDEIDIELVRALSALLALYAGDFTLDGLVRNVDIKGQYGTMLSAVSGYLEQSGKNYRVIDIFLPLIVNDVWSEAP